MFIYAYLRDMPLPAQHLPNYTYSDYLQWEGRWELIAGIPYAMTPMASPKHQRISALLTALWVTELQKEENCPCMVYQPIDLKVAENTVLQPDLLICCFPIEGQYLDQPPSLVIEILSPSTEFKDRHTKFDIYQQFGIPYYLIIDIHAEKIEAYHLNGIQRYDSFDWREGFNLHEQCHISADLSSIWNG